MLASVEAQVRRDVEPALTLAGFAVRLSVGAGAVTATATSREIVPPGPVQLSPKVVPVVSAALLSLPVVAWEPDQPPVAVHVVALVEDQVRELLPPAATDAGLVDSATVGAGGGGGGVTVTVTEAVPVPPVPEQFSV